MTLCFCWLPMAVTRLLLLAGLAADTRAIAGYAPGSDDGAVTSTVARRQMYDRNRGGSRTGGGGQQATEAALLTSTGARSLASSSRHGTIFGLKAGLTAAASRSCVLSGEVNQEEPLDLILMLKERNFLVFTMPEIATEMYRWSDGKMWDDFSAQGPDEDRVWASLQTSLTRVQMAIEDSIVHMAHRSLSKRRKGPNPPEGAVVLLDRGVIDNVAYCTDEAWAMVLEDLGTTTARLRDSRYDHVRLVHFRISVSYTHLTLPTILLV